MRLWLFWVQIDAIFLSLILGIFCLFAYRWRREKVLVIWSVSWLLVVIRIYLGLYHLLENEYRFLHDFLYIASDIGWLWGISELLARKKKIFKYLLLVLTIQTAANFYFYFIKGSIVGGTFWSLVICHPVLLAATAVLFWVWGKKIKAFAPKLISASYLLWSADFIIFGAAYYAHGNQTAGMWGWTIGIAFRTCVFIGFLILILRPYYSETPDEKIFRMSIRDRMAIFSVASLILLGLTILIFLQLILPKFISRRESVIEILRHISMIITFIVAIYSIVSTRLSHAILNPVYRLFKGIDRVKRGELKQISEIKTYDEVELLSDEFNELFSKLGTLYFKLEETYLSIISTLINAVESKDPFLAGHSIEVGKTARKIAEKLGLSKEECKQIEWAGYLHDIGKIGIPISILNKPVGLTEEELKIVRKHAANGSEILKSLPFIGKIIPYIKYHHEKYDGTGYTGVKGENIPLGARIVAAADAFCAMSSDRPYRKAKSKKEIIEEIKKLSGKQFDPQIVEVLLKIVESAENRQN